MATSRFGYDRPEHPGERPHPRDGLGVRMWEDQLERYDAMIQRQPMLALAQAWSPEPPRAWDWSQFLEVFTFTRRMEWLVLRAKKAIERRVRANS